MTASPLKSSVKTIKTTPSPGSKRPRSLTTSAAALKDGDDKEPPNDADMEDVVQGEMPIDPEMNPTTVVRRPRVIEDEEEDTDNETSSDVAAASDTDDDDDEVEDDVDAGATGSAPASKKAKRMAKSDTTSPTKQQQKKKKATPANGKTKAKAKAPAKLDGASTLALAYLDLDVEPCITWPRGKPLPYMVLAQAFEDVAEESKRLVITERMTRVFRAVLLGAPDDLLPVVYLCINMVAPSHEGVELGLGEATLIKAMANALGKSEKSIKESYQTVGDLGSLAVAAKGSQKTMFKPPPLTAAGVFKAFKDIAAIEGKNAVERRVSLITKLLAASEDIEAGYLLRSLQGKLRIGLAEQTVLTALAHATYLHHAMDKQEGGNMEKKQKSAKLAEALLEPLARSEETLKTVFSNLPSYDLVVPELIRGGVEGLDGRCAFQPLLPVKPMLAKSTTGVQEVLDKFEGREFTCEYKYDGERAQIHVTDGGETVRIFSRSSENMTSKYPDIVARVKKMLAPGTKSVVLDCEAVAWDPEEKKILPFQVLSTRARKDVRVDNVKVQVMLFPFDCLYYNGQALFQEPLTLRRERMREAIVEVEGEVAFAVYKTSVDLEELSLFLDESIAASTEGLIVKTLDDTYEPSKRSLNWLKLKKDYLEVGDTIDVVPIGAWHGRGKRTGVYGSFLLAVYYGDNEEFQTISKIGTGFSEEQLVAFSTQLEETVIPKPKVRERRRKRRT